MFSFRISNLPLILVKLTIKKHFTRFSNGSLLVSTFFRSLISLATQPINSCYFFRDQAHFKHTAQYGTIINTANIKLRLISCEHHTMTRIKLTRDIKKHYHKMLWRSRYVNYLSIHALSGTNLFFLFTSFFMIWYQEFRSLGIRYAGNNMLEFIVNRTFHSLWRHSYNNIATIVQLIAFGSKCCYLSNYLAIYVFSAWWNACKLIQTKTHWIVCCPFHTLLHIFKVNLNEFRKFKCNFFKWISIFI